MKKKSTSLVNSLGSLLLLGSLVVADKCISKLEAKLQSTASDEKKLNRQLNIASLLYHAIGIFYNE